MSNKTTPARGKLTRLFSDREFLKRLWSLALPIALQSLLLASVAAADALMLGGLDQNAMAAVSQATQIQFIQNMLLSAATGVVGILGAQYWGKGDKETVKRVLCICLRLCGGVSVVFFSACLFAPRYLMLLFTDQEELIGMGVDYLKLAAFSYLMTGVSQSFLAVMKVSDRAAMSARISAVSVIINIVLNAVFIFGPAGLPAMGIRGAALATVIARAVELIWSVLISLKRDYLSPSPKQLLSPDWALSRDFYKCMLPLLGASMLWGVGFTSYTSFMGHMGKDAAAANSVAAVVRDLVCCACNGLAYGGGILVGNELGAGRPEKGRLYGDRIASLGFLCGFAGTALMLLVTVPLLKLVSLTPEAERLLLGMMVIMSVYMIGRTVNTVLINGIFAAGGDTVFDLYSLAVTMWGLAIPLAVLGTFVLHWHPLIVYACTCLDEVGKIPWVVLHYRKYKWVKDLTK